MANKTFEPVGLLDIAKQIKTNRKSVDDLTERMQTALDHKRDVASNYVEQLDKEVEVKLDPITDLIQNSAKANDAVFMAGFDAGYEKGFWKGYNKIHSIASSEQRDRELLESHGIDVDGFCDDMVNMIQQREIDAENQGLRPDIDEDEPDQYPDNYGGTK